MPEQQENSAQIQAAVHCDTFYLDEFFLLLTRSLRCELNDWNRYHITAFMAQLQLCPFIYKEPLRALEMFLTSERISVKSAEPLLCHLWLGVLQEDMQENLPGPLYPAHPGHVAKLVHS